MRAIDVTARSRRAVMEIIYAAEKLTIAEEVRKRLRLTIRPQDIEICEDPDQTGRFRVRSEHGRYLFTPGGQLLPDLR